MLGVVSIGRSAWQSFGMHDVSPLLDELIAQLESSKPNPTLWSSSAARALEQQLTELQHRLRLLQSQLIHLPRISL
jgi:hypothetical protein